MFFDRYEFHIQAFIHSINGRLIIFNPHPHKTIFEMFTQNLYMNNIFQTHSFRKINFKT